MLSWQQNIERKGPIFPMAQKLDFQLFFFYLFWKRILYLYYQYIFCWISEPIECQEETFFKLFSCVSWIKGRQRDNRMCRIMQQRAIFAIKKVVILSCGWTVMWTLMHICALLSFCCVTAGASMEWHVIYEVGRGIRVWCGFYLEKT